jgi:4-amino-4-deoxy-L-arabinose transferase-like glycosyltransferase
VKVPVVDLEWVTSARSRWLTVSLLALVIGTAPVFLRTFINDDATYVLVAQKLNAGGQLYRDGVDNKPPLMYATVAAAFWVLGKPSLLAVKLLTIAAHLGCAALLFLIGGRLFGRKVGALAALFFSCAVVTGRAEDFAAPNTEAFMNLCALGSLAMVARDPQTASRRAWLAAGALAGVGALYRLQGATLVLASLLFIWRYRRARGAFVGPAISLVVGFALPLAATLAWLTARGTLADFWLWAIRNNVGYVGVGVAHFGWRALGRIALVALSQLPLLAAAIPTGAAWLRTREPERARSALVWLQLLGALVAFQMGTRFYGHYFLQALPFLSLIAAWGYVSLPRERLPWLRLTPHLLAIWLCGSALTNAVRLSTADDDAAGLRDVVAFIKTASTPQDQVWLWSAPADVAFDSDRRYATRFPFNNYLTGRIFGTDHALPGATRQSNRALESAEGWRLLAEDLAAAPPAIIVDGRTPGFEIGSYQQLAGYLQRHYETALRFGRFDVYRRRTMSLAPPPSPQ